MSKLKIGVTTTVPCEILWAAGLIPVDLNNIFINHPQKEQLVDYAEIHGFPRNSCSWIKGIYAVVKKMQFEKIIAVTYGDCSNTQALMEILTYEGVETIPFAYPHNADRKMLKLGLDELINKLGTDWETVNKTQQRLLNLRKKIHCIDKLTWEGTKITGWENHFYLVSTSDMQGDIDNFEQQADKFIAEVNKRPVKPPKIRLAYIGVPPICPQLYDYLEQIGARVVFNEVQRQFAMPYYTADLVEQYCKYTYPYGIFKRLADIKYQLKQRNIDGLIHYVQSFCFRQIEDIIVRKELNIPILTLEGDRPAPLDARTKLRLESFIETLSV